MFTKIKRNLTFQFGCHFVNILGKREEIDLLVKCLRGVSGAGMIYWQHNSETAKIFVLGNTNEVEFALRQLVPRFNLSYIRANVGRY
jgi:hypothetical protein